MRRAVLVEELSAQRLLIDRLVERDGDRLVGGQHRADRARHATDEKIDARVGHLQGGVGPDELQRVGADRHAAGDTAGRNDARRIDLEAGAGELIGGRAADEDRRHVDEHLGRVRAEEVERVVGRQPAERRHAAAVARRRHRVLPERRQRRKRAAAAVRIVVGVVLDLHARRHRHAGHRRAAIVDERHRERPRRLEQLDRRHRRLRVRHREVADGARQRARHVGRLVIRRRDRQKEVAGRHLGEGVDAARVGHRHQRRARGLQRHRRASDRHLAFEVEHDAAHRPLRVRVADGDIAVVVAAERRHQPEHPR